MVGPMRPQIVLFGSSIVQFSFGNQGWGAILSALYARKADVVLRGYAGWNTKRAVQVLDQIFPKDAAIQPSLVIVYFGGNDSMSPHPSGRGPHVPLSEYKENIKKIALYLKSLSPNTRVLFLSTPPINEQQIRDQLSTALADARSNEVSRIYSEACLEVCGELDIKAVDLWTALQQRDDWMTTTFVDGIHLTAEASKVVVKEIMKVLREVNWEPSLYWKSMPNEFRDGLIFEMSTPTGKVAVTAAEVDCYRDGDWE